MTFNRLSNLLALSLAALSAPSHAEFWDIAAPAYPYHQIGSFLGGWWRTEINNVANGQFSTYGPFATNLSEVGELLVFSKFGMAPNPGKSLTMTWDILNGSSTVYTKTILQNYDPASPFGGTFDLMKLLPPLIPQSNIQVRTRVKGVGTMDQCGGLHIMTEDENMDLRLYAYPTFYHQAGDRVPGTWDWEGNANSPECANGNCVSKFLSYGPYIEFPNSMNTTSFAVFKLSLDNTAGNNDAIALLDVMAYDGSTYRVLKEQVVYRKDFLSGMAMTPFILKFQRLNTYSQFQFRVRWYGLGVLRQSFVKVFTGDANQAGTCTW